MPKTAEIKPNANSRSSDLKNAEVGVDSPFWNTREAAAFLHSSPRTLEKFRLIGQGPSFIKVGRKVLYEIEELKSWAKAQRRRSTSDLGQLE